MNIASSSSGSGLLPSNTVPNPRTDLKAITTRSGVTLARPSVSLPPFKEVPEVTKKMVQPSTENIQPPVVQTHVPIDEPVNLLFELSFADALLRMPKFALMFKSLLNNKEKLFDLATTPVNENCLAVILKKLPEKLGDTVKFLIPCDFQEFDECLALADLDRLTTRPAGISEDVFVKVGKFHFPTDFVVVDYVVDPRVPLILERPFLRTGRALIDVYGEELTLRVDDEEITFNFVQTSKHSYKDVESINRIDVIDVAYPIISSSSTSFTPFEGSDFILEEIETFLQTPDELSDLDDDYYDMKGDILYLKKLLNEDLSPNLPPVKTGDLKQVDATMTKSSIEEPSDLELKELPSYSEYTIFEGTDKLPIIISKELKDEEKSTLLKVLKSHKWAIAWKISDIKDYRKLNDATRKDHFPLPFMDQMLERLAGNEFYCFLDGYSGYFQIPIDPQDQEKTTFTCPYGTFAYRRMPFALCNAPGTFQMCKMAIFHDMIEKTME
nr:hypothetical protein [Tanacetum cinerariifolium]